MLSFLFLASVASASFSENLVAENIISMNNRISSKLRMDTLDLVRQHARHYKARRLGESTCMWDGDAKKCGLGAEYMFSEAKGEEAHPMLQSFAFVASKCLELKKDDCTGSSCAYKNDECQVSDEAGEKFMKDIMAGSVKECGAFMQMYLNSCEQKSKADCTDKCEYHEKGDDYEFDEKSKSCKQTPVCKKKFDPKDPTGIKAIEKQSCPDLETVSKECNAKNSTQLKIDCYGKKCPIALIMVGAIACGTSQNEQTCLGNDKLCAYDAKSENKCSLNMDNMMDLIIPKTCWLSPLLRTQQECQTAKTKDACKGKCEWQTESSCDKENVKTTNKCGTNGESAVLSLLGRNAVRTHELCQGSQTEASCTKVTPVPDNTGAVASDDSAVKTLVYTIMIVFAGLVVMM